MHKAKHAFTLIELLVVIAILAILMVAVVMALNPSELLKQARDSNRLSDLSAIKTALALYQTDVQPIAMGNASTSYLSLYDAAATGANGCPSSSGLPSDAQCAASSTYRLPNSTGWIPVDLTKISIGSPLAELPVDPINSAASGLYYTYATDGTLWEVCANAESQKFKAQFPQSPSFTAGTSLTLINSSSATTTSNPVPTIAAITPTSTIGAADLAMTVTGTNFVSNSVVNINGSPEATTFVSSSSLTAVIAAAALTTASTSSITVFNPTPGGGTSNAQTLAVVDSWVLVPGNATFGTSNFYAMKYSAVCSDGNGNYINDNNTGYNTYSDTGKNCTPANNRQIASLSGGWPIANISQISAASYCASLSGTTHLMTNNEWQTIAWNAENQASNWYGGGVGTNYIYSGHNDNQPADALVATSTDSDGYYGETNTGGNQRRTLTLSNGSIIWDMAGNVWQWTNDTITGSNEPHGSATGWSWQEFPTVTTWGSMTSSTAGPANASWNSTNGVGQLYSENVADSTIYGFLRGGRWDNTAVVGVATLNLNNTPADTNISIGFRCVR